MYLSLFLSRPVLRGGRLVKTKRGVVSLAPLIGGLVLCAGGAVAQEVCETPIGGPAGSEMCDISDIVYDDLGNSAASISADGNTFIGRPASTAMAIRWLSGAGMELLGALETGAYAFSRGVNADGSVVVGRSATSVGTRAFRWVEGEGMLNLGVLSGGDESSAEVVSDNGLVVAGYSDTEHYARAFRWTEATGMESLGLLSGGGFNSIARGINADGSVIVGVCGIFDQDTHSITYNAFRWTRETGMLRLEGLGGDNSFANATNDDGTVVVGEGTDNSQSAWEAFRWVEGEGVEYLGTLGGSDSHAWGVNSDGSVVVGTSDSPDGYRAFRWSEEDGMESLGTLNGGASAAYGVSADGTIVVGVVENVEGQRIFIWRDTAGGGTMEDLANLTASIPVLGRDTALTFATQQSAVQTVMQMRGQAGAAVTPRVSSKGADDLAGAFGSGGGNFLKAQLALSATSGDPITYGRRTTTIGALSYGHGVSDQLTLGAAVDLQSDSLKNNAFDMKTGAGLALWADYSAGGAAGTGWQASGALGYAHATGTITRGRPLSNVVNATGQSSLTTRAVEAQIGYGIASAEGLVLTPSLTLAHVETRRPGYAESGAAFNAVYDAEQVGRTTLTLALDGEKTMGPKGTLRFGFGVERDLHAESARLSGTSDLPSLATFDIASDEDRNRTRPFASVGYAHAITDGTVLSASAAVSRAEFGTKPSVDLGLGVEMHF